MAFGDFVQGVFTDDPGSPSAVSVGTVTAGNLLIAAFLRFTDSTPTVSDSLGHTWTLARSHYDAGNDFRLDVWYAIATSSGDCVITITVAGGGNEAMRAEFAGPFAAAPLDAVNSANGQSTSASSGTVSPSVNGVLAVGYHGATQPLASSGAWVSRVNGNTFTWFATLLQSQVRPDTTAVAATATLSEGVWASIVATFKPVAGEEPSTRRSRLLLLGVGS
jgi:hypothetical protein